LLATDLVIHSTRHIDGVSKQRARTAERALQAQQLILHFDAGRCFCRSCGWALIAIVLLLRMLHLRVLLAARVVHLRELTAGAR
jgi:hypothetical protein